MSFALRLYAEHDDTESIVPPVSPSASTGLTLRDVWETLKRPEIEQEGRAAETLADYGRHLDRWEEFFETPDGQKYRIINPALGQIDREMLLAWRGWLTRRPMGARSANKHLGTIHALLACAESHRKIGATPRLPPLSTHVAAAKLYLSYQEIDQLYEACELATWPRQDGRGEDLPWPAVRYWRALIVMLFNYGCRTQELVAYERSAKPMRWRQIHWQRESPAIAGRALCDWGWLAYVPTKQERHKPEPLVLPLNEATAWHLKSIEPPEVDVERPLFDWPLSPDSFYQTWDEILAGSKVKPKADPVTGEAAKYQLLHFRKTCTTWLNHHCRGIAPHITGHAARGRDDAVSSKHYDNVELAVLKALRELPQPSAFQAAMLGNQQRLLF